MINICKNKFKYFLLLISVIFFFYIISYNKNIKSYKEQNSFILNSKKNTEKNNEFLFKKMKYIKEKYISSNNFDKAEIEYKRLLSIPCDENIKCIIIINLSRIQIFLKKFNCAYKNLNTIKVNEWKPLSLMYKGDIELLKGDKDKAVCIYNNILKLNCPESIKNLIMLKLRNI
ncbi:membrane protein [endosymbiont of Sipalinus gigas]|uniref:tetratricopeptide repeat protein n=1 Tax=endosymbiont of Sipalinus gigas TaxID=1972134 RepID=UPI000DC6E66F|nr:tetratricopeptide repeat protein [endosymbiont of Sipalinus gigas]BBA85303.1 membrane protein [endosymbiont of Sipalinus gigas]